jgi:hypothetical protein
MEIISIGYALLAVQSALLREVTPELRAVMVDICEESELFYIRFYYDGEVSEKQIDFWECAITEASAGLGPDCGLDGQVERLDYPEKIPFRGRYAYLRKEVNLLPNPFLAGLSPIIQREIVDFKENIGFFVSPVDTERVPTSWGVIHYAPDGCHIIPAKSEKYKISIFPLAYALLALQRGMLGVVTPELRSVIADIDQENQLLYIRFFYDGDVPYENIDEWECAISESIADLGPEYSLDAKVERIDYPKEMPFRGRYAYFRKEAIKKHFST